MLIVRGGYWPEHRLWFRATSLVAMAFLVWYSVEAVKIGRMPGGGSLVGLVTGVSGGLIIVFEMLLWPRKKLRLLRVGRAKLWMKAHIWLGLLSLPLIVMHSGLRWWGGALTSLLMFEFLAVIASGLVGLVFQQVMPRAMLENVPAETIKSQIPPILEQYLDEAGRIVRMTCGLVEPRTSAAAQVEARKVLVIGAERTLGVPAGESARHHLQVPQVSGSGPLLTFFESTVRPYLEARKGTGMLLASSNRAEATFRNVRSRLDPAAHGVVDRLEDLCERRRQFDIQVCLHGWLHGWLIIHLPLSVSMFLLMLAHVYYAARFH